MKRTRKIRKTFTDAQKRGLVNEVITLIGQGLGTGVARARIAAKHGTTHGSLARWSKDIAISTTTITGRITATEPHITSIDLHIPGTGNITLDSKTLRYISTIAPYTD